MCFTDSGIRKKLWEKAIKRAKAEFRFVHTTTDALNTILLLSLYKVKSKHRRIDNIFLSYSNITEMTSDTYITFTIEIISELLYEAKKNNPNETYSIIIESTLTDYIILPTDFYTDNISPIYTIVGSKNNTMQKATASAVESMNLNHERMTLVDACCATGSLFFGLKSYQWKSIILNDLNPLITNFLNVLKQEPLKLIKSILSTPVFSNKEHLFEYMAEAHSITKGYEAQRIHYHKADCNIEIATTTFIYQCVSKEYPENSDKILNRITRIIPASINLQSAIITQEDCIKYLDNDINKFILFDVPYIGSEYTCSARGYNYNRFHKRIATNC